MNAQERAQECNRLARHRLREEEARHTADLDEASRVLSKRWTFDPSWSSLSRRGERWLPRSLWLPWEGAP